MTAIFEADYDLGERVYFTLGEVPGIVTGVTFSGSGTVYWVTWMPDLRETKHYVYELAREPNYAGKAG